VASRPAVRVETIGGRERVALTVAGIEHLLSPEAAKELGVWLVFCAELASEGSPTKGSTPNPTEGDYG
jgi:hypothetical protein